MKVSVCDTPVPGHGGTARGLHTLELKPLEIICAAACPWLPQDTSSGPG